MSPLCIGFLPDFCWLFAFVFSLGCVYLCSHLPCTFVGWVPILWFLFIGFFFIVQNPHAHSINPHPHYANQENHYVMEHATRYKLVCKCFVGCGMVQEMLNYMQHPDTEFDSQEMVSTNRLWGRCKSSPQWHGFTTNKEIQQFLFSSILFSDGGQLSFLFSFRWWSLSFCVMGAANIWRRYRKRWIQKARLKSLKNKPSKI